MRTAAVSVSTMQLELGREHTVLYVQDARTARSVPYQRPTKYQLAGEMHNILRNNAYSCLPHKTTANSRHGFSFIEHCHDYETSTYKHLEPCSHVATPSKAFRYEHDCETNQTVIQPKAGTSLTFPEDLDSSFHRGRLDTSIDCIRTSIPTCSTLDGFSARSDRLLTISTHSDSTETSNMVVPDCDDSNCSGLPETTMTDSFYTTPQIKTPRKETDTSSNKPTATNKHSLPLLFYPRTAKKGAVGEGSRRVPKTYKKSYKLTSRITNFV